jgi:hypothetical protein
MVHSDKLTVTQLDRKFVDIMENEGSLPCSQETGPNPEPDDSNLLP